MGDQDLTVPERQELKVPTIDVDRITLLGGAAGRLVAENNLLYRQYNERLREAVEAYSRREDRIRRRFFRKPVIETYDVLPSDYFGEGFRELQDNVERELLSDDRRLFREGVGDISVYGLQGIRDEIDVFLGYSFASPEMRAQYERMCERTSTTEEGRRSTTKDTERGNSLVQSMQMVPLPLDEESRRDFVQRIMTAAQRFYAELEGISDILSVYEPGEEKSEYLARDVAIMNEALRGLADQFSTPQTGLYAIMLDHAAGRIQEQINAKLDYLGSASGLYLSASCTDIAEELGFEVKYKGRDCDKKPVAAERLVTPSN